MIAYNYSEPRGLHKSVNQAELRDSYYERGKFMTMKRKYWPLAVAGILAVSAAGCQNTGMESAAASSVAVQESAASTAAAAGNDSSGCGDYGCGSRDAIWKRRTSDDQHISGGRYAGL